MHRLARLGRTRAVELVNAADTPHLGRWIGQINARPKVQEMFAAVPREPLGPPKVA